MTSHLLTFLDHLLSLQHPRKHHPQTLPPNLLDPLIMPRTLGVKVPPPDPQAEAVIGLPRVSASGLIFLLLVYDSENNSFRCLAITHRQVDCPYKNEICDFCRDDGLADLAIGHTRRVFLILFCDNLYYICRIVHSEKDPQRQSIITRLLPVGCFREWTGHKRSFPPK